MNPRGRSLAGEGGFAVSLETIAGLFISYGYWIVFVAILLDNAGLPIPGELFLVALGGVARMGHLDPTLGLLVAASAAVMGDSLGYWGGRVAGDWIGGGLMVRGRPAGLAVVLGRFVVGARVLVAPLSGLTRMPFATFVALDAFGCVLWTGAFIALGYGAGGWAMKVNGGLPAVIVVVELALAVVLAVHLLRRVARPRRVTEPAAAATSRAA